MALPRALMVVVVGGGDLHIAWRGADKCFSSVPHSGWAECVESHAL